MEIVIVKFTKEEIWKPVVELPSYYEVSSLGRVRSLDRRTSFDGKNQVGFFTCERIKKGRMLELKDLRNGYYYVNLYTGLKIVKYSVHRLVAKAFLPNPQNLPQVNHTDGNKLNNEVSNLEWCSASENRLHATRVLKELVGEKHGQAKLTEEQVLEIRELKGSLSAREISKLYPVGPTQVQRICKNETWKHLEGI